MCAGEILIDPVMKILCLPDIDHFPVPVLHLIASRCTRQIRQFSLNIFLIHLISLSS